MEVSTSITCLNCHSDFIFFQQYQCSNCDHDGSNLFFNYQQGFDTKTIRAYLQKNKLFSMDRYHCLFPINKYQKAHLPSVGGTPLHRATQIESSLKIAAVWIKNEALNLTGSMKDRAAYLTTMQAILNREKVVCTASTGNQAISVSAFSAAAGISSIVFVSKNISSEKLNLLKLYGAKIVLVEGNYDNSVEACFNFTKRYKLANRTAGRSPLCIEGMKTCAFEICEQLNWEIPSWILLPVGDGTIYASIYKGFYDFFKLGLIDKFPQIVGVQSKQCAPVVDAWRKKSNGVTKRIPATIAESIAAGIPRDKDRLFSSLRACNGLMIAIDDQEIIKSKLWLSAYCGLCVETASASVLSALKSLKRKKIIKKEDSIVLIMTGHGNKETTTYKNILEEQLTYCESSISKIL